MCYCGNIPTVVYVKDFFKNNRVQLHVFCIKKTCCISGVKTFLNEFVAYSYLGEITNNMAFYNNATSQNMSTSFFRQGVWLHGGGSMVNNSGIGLADHQAFFNGTDVFLRRGILSVSKVLVWIYFMGTTSRNKYGKG